MTSPSIVHFNISPGITVAVNPALVRRVSFNVGNTSKIVFDATDHIFVPGSIAEVAKRLWPDRYHAMPA